MPLFFFDVHDGKITRDDEGQEVADLEAVRRLAMETLPRVAADEISSNGDKQNFVVLVRDEDKRPVYSATLNFVGLWL